MTMHFKGMGQSTLEQPRFGARPAFSARLPSPGPPARPAFAYRGMGQALDMSKVLPTSSGWTSSTTQQAPITASRVAASVNPALVRPASSANIAAPGTPTCLSLAQVQLLSACFGKTAPPGMDQGFFDQACAAASAGNLFGLPYCPGEQLPAVPPCLDATWAGNLSYCEQNPTSTGPDPSKNAICWAARKSPAFYNSVKATPVCGGAPIIDGGGPVKDEPAGSEPNYMLWGGLALLLVAAGGGVYYYTRKSSPAPMAANGWRRRQKALNRKKRRRR